ALLRDPRVSSDQNNADLAQVMLAAQDVETPQDAPNVKPFLFMDPPHHTRVRGLVTKAFTPRVVQLLRARVHGIVDELIEAGAHGGRAGDHMRPIAGCRS